MSRTGRPQIFDDVKQQLFLRLVAGGLSARDAARHIGVSPSTIREKKRKSPAFSAAYDKAKDQAIPALLDSIYNAGQRSWRASAWLLERLRPAQFGRRVALGVDPSIPRPPKRPRAYLDEEMTTDFFSRLRMLPQAQALAHEKLAAVEAEQEAWDAARKAYHDKYTARGLSPGFGPGEWGPHPAWSEPSPADRCEDSTPASPQDPNLVARRVSEGSDAPDVSSSANNSANSDDDQNAQTESTQRLDAADGGHSPPLLGA